jgi:hypothetical protein
MFGKAAASHTKAVLTMVKDVRRCLKTVQNVKSCLKTVKDVKSWLFKNSYSVKGCLINS